MTQIILEQLPNRVKSLIGLGKVASYIPALNRIPPDKFGVAVHYLSGELHKVGDAEETFSLQSIAKILSLVLALRFFGDPFWDKVGRKLTTKPFNSLTSIEEADGTPGNPFTNAGAITLVEILLNSGIDFLNETLDLSRQLTGNHSIQYDQEVAASEQTTGFRNYAIAQFLKSYGLIQSPVETVLEAYFKLCALTMNCVDLSRAFLFLANQGVNPLNGNRVVTPQQCRRLNALLLMFGTYDAAGEFVFRVGLPVKSGVGGGLLAVVPGKMTIATWSPALDDSGTSIAGMKALEILSNEAGLSIL